MELTSNTLGTISMGTERPEYLIVDLTQTLPVLLQCLNLLPQNVPYPDLGNLVKMSLDSVSSKLSPAPHVLKAKVEDIFKNVDAVHRETIFVNLLVLGLQIVETLNAMNLWTEAGYAMYTFDHFLNDNTIVLGRVKAFSY